jgi:hypothetical protein
MIVYTICQLSLALLEEKLKTFGGNYDDIIDYLLKTIIMWSDFNDSGRVRKRPWSEAHTNMQGMFCSGSYCSIPKKSEERRIRRF